MIFTIFKGFHFSNRFIYKLSEFFNTKTKMSYYVTFNETAIYTIDSVNQSAENKLFGFSNGMHHTNSYRFAWNSLDGELHLFAYVYIDSICVKKEIGIIPINEELSLTIKLTGTKCIFTCVDRAGMIKQLIMDVKVDKVFGYKLWPYFGGKIKAPHTIKIQLTKHE